MNITCRVFGLGYWVARLFRSSKPHISALCLFSQNDHCLRCALALSCLSKDLADMPDMAAPRQHWLSKATPYSSVRTTDDISSTLEAPAEKSRKTGNWWQDGWLLEILSALGSILAIVTIAILLKRCDDRPIPSFPLGATVSTDTRMNICAIL